MHDDALSEMIKISSTLNSTETLNQFELIIEIWIKDIRKKDHITSYKDYSLLKREVLKA